MLRCGDGDNGDGREQVREDDRGRDDEQHEEQLQQRAQQRAWFGDRPHVMTTQQLRCGADSNGRGRADDDRPRRRGERGQRGGRREPHRYLPRMHRQPDIAGLMHERQPAGCVEKVPDRRGAAAGRRRDDRSRPHAAKRRP